LYPWQPSFGVTITLHEHDLSERVAEHGRLNERPLTQTTRTHVHSFIHKSTKLVPCGTDGRLLLSGFQALVTLTLTLILDRVIQHTVVHQSSTSIYTPNFIGIGKKPFVDALSAGTPPSSRSRDTKRRTNIKNPVPSLRIGGHL